MDEKSLPITPKASFKWETWCLMGMIPLSSIRAKIMLFKRSHRNCQAPRPSKFSDEGVCDAGASIAHTFVGS